MHYNEQDPFHLYSQITLLSFAMHWLQPLLSADRHHHNALFHAY